MPIWLQIVLRTLTAVIGLFIITKILGKRQITQLSTFDYITGITIGSMAAYVCLDFRTPWYTGIIGLVVWTAVSLGLQYLAIKSKFARDLINGTGTILIKDGKILEDNLKKARLTSDDLLEQLRGHQAFKVADVEFAVLESNGNVNVLLNKQNQPLTPQHFGMRVAPEQEPQTVIMDGEVLNEPLATLGLSHQWLSTELEKLGVAIENVYLGQVDAYGALTIDLFDDKLKVPQPQQKAVLLATLKKCEADIEMFGLGTKDKQAKAMYSRCSGQLQEVISAVRPILTR